MNLLKRLFKQIISPEDPRHREGFVVYVSPGCACCEDALRLMRSAGVEPCVLDIDDDPEFRRIHGAGVPIVKVDGRVRFFGKVDPALFRRLLVHRSKQSG